MAKIRLGLSACLAGEAVRYDGGHRWEPFLTATWERDLEFLPVCPEVECGLGVPREPLRLVARPGAATPRLLTVRRGQDLTRRLLTWAGRRVRELAREDLCGFIFKSGSPSCGVGRVKIYPEQGAPAATGTGLFAAVLMAHLPLVPVADELRLRDPELRENFIERLFFQRRWREFLGGLPDEEGLAAFHGRHRLQIMAHSPEQGRGLDRLLAATGRPLAERVSAYQDLALAAMRLKATVPKNLGVLDNLVARFRKSLRGEELQELQEAVDSYRRGEAPLLAAVTLINHYARQYRGLIPPGQTYLNPHPTELRLRHHA